MGPWRAVNAENGSVHGGSKWSRAGSVRRPVVADSHHFDEDQDPDNQQSEKTDPNPYYSEESKPDPP